jgi:hypothetical protein
LSHHREGIRRPPPQMHLERGMIATLDAIKIATEAPSPKTPVPIEPSASAQALVLAAVFDFGKTRVAREAATGSN